MKRIKLLSLLTIIACIVFFTNDFINGFMDGYHETDDQTEYASTVHLRVKPTEAAVPDSLYCTATESRIPYHISSLDASADIHPSTGYEVVTVLSGLCALLGLYGIYCFVRLLISVMRGQVFTRKNIRRMRFFTYSLMLFALCIELQQWFMHHDMTSQFALDGYTAVDYELKGAWVSYFLLALFTEIFAVGVKLKEEQELTI